MKHLSAGPDLGVWGGGGGGGGGWQIDLSTVHERIGWKRVTNMASGISYMTEDGLQNEQLYQ